MRTLLAGLLVVAVTLAGCTEDPEPVTPGSNQGGNDGDDPLDGPGVNETADDLNNATADLPADPVTTVFALDFLLAAGTAGQNLINFQNGNGGGFEVLAGAQGLLLEGQWSCTSAGCKLNTFFNPPGDDNATFEVEGDGGFRHEINTFAGPIPDGGWTATAWARDVVIQGQGEIRVTVFYQEPIPPGWSAFGQAAGGDDA